MPRLPESWLRELYERTDLRQLIGSYVELREKGGRLWGCCPFHHETEPSFTVNEQQGFYHCFGCGQHGNAVGFVMEMERLGFREACEFLADRVGLEMPQLEEDSAARAGRALAERIRLANREAASYFHQCLEQPLGRPGNEYLAGRGVGREIQARFGLGYAPDAWHGLRDHLLGKGFTARELTAAGLLQEKNGRTYDAFRNRVIFPIISPQGSVIGFGGRVLGEGVPKYLNSPATPVFNKSRSLYNLNTARTLRQRGELPRLILMEGYMDVIGAARSGVMNTCATLGTALTSDQCRLIRRYVEEVCICYDGDGAGVKAALRALGLLAEADVQARVVYLPDGMDPDEYLQANGREAFESQIANSLEPMAFRFRVARSGRDLSVPADRTAYAKDCVQLLREEKSALVRQQYAELLQKETGYRLEAILDDVGTQAAAAKPVQLRASSSGPSEARAENFAAAVLAARPDLAGILVKILKPEDFDHPVNAALCRYVNANAGRGAEISEAELLEVMDGPEQQKHIRRLIEALQRFGDDTDGLKSMLGSSVAKLRVRRIRRQKQALTEGLSAITDPEEVERRQRQIMKLGRQLQEWKQQVPTVG